ncbi:MAG: helicase C-terminal domain-containing protein [Nanoarchaeota archaeon]
MSNSFFNDAPYWRRILREQEEFQRKKNNYNQIRALIDETDVLPADNLNDAEFETTFLATRDHLDDAIRGKWYLPEDFSALRDLLRNKLSNVLEERVCDTLTQFSSETERTDDGYAIEAIIDSVKSYWGLLHGLLFKRRHLTDTAIEHLKEEKKSVMDDIFSKLEYLSRENIREFVDALSEGTQFDVSIQSSIHTLDLIEQGKLISRNYKRVRTHAQETGHPHHLRYITRQVVDSLSAMIREREDPRICPPVNHLPPAATDLRDDDPDIPIGPIDLTDLLDTYPLFFRTNGKRTSEFRREQVKFMTLVYEGIQGGRPIIVEGPTGLGKTRAILAAAIPYLHTHPEARLLYTTRTVSQVSNVMEEIKGIFDEAPNLALPASLLIGRKRIKDSICMNCPKEETDEDNHCEGLHIAGKDMAGIDELVEDFLLGEKFGVLDEKLMKTISEEKIHPSWFMEFQAQRSRIIVFPTAYLDDGNLRSRLSGYGSSILIIDEAHNYLEDLCRTHYFLLEKGKTIPALIRNIEETDLFRHADLTYRDVHLSDVVGYFRHLEDEIFKQDYPESFITGSTLDITITSLTDEVMDDLTNAYTLLDTFMLCLDRVEHNNDLVRQLANLHRLTGRLLTLFENPYDFALIGRRENNMIQAYALHPKYVCHEHLAGFRSTIFSSATLSPTDEISLILDLPRAITAQLRSDFSNDNYCPFYVLGVNSSAKERDEEHVTYFSPKEELILEDILKTCIRAGRGRNIGLFTNSNECTQRIGDIMNTIKRSASGQDKPYIISYAKSNKEGFIMPPDDYHELCERMRLPRDHPDDELHKISLFKSLASENITVVLLGVSGGTLSEGVDYRDKMMEMIIQVGIPYPANGTELALSALRENYFYMVTGDQEKARDYAFRHSALRKCTQSLGRANRSKSDRSVLIFIDERIVGLKNRGDEYELLNAINARNNRQILPPCFHRYDNNIVLPSEVSPEYLSLMQSYLKGDRNHLITPEQMERRIIGFYAHETH